MSKQQRYTPELKTEAVKLVLEQGIQQSLAARRLSIPEGTWLPGLLLPSQQHRQHQHSVLVQQQIFLPRLPNFVKSWQKLVWAEADLAVVEWCLNNQYEHF